MTRQRRTLRNDHSAPEPDLQEIAYQTWASLTPPKPMRQVQHIMQNLSRNEGLLAELSESLGVPTVLPADYAAPDLPTLWQWRGEGGWLQRYAEESAAASRDEEVQVAAAVSKQRPGLKMRRMTVWEGILTAAERAVFEIDEDGNALIGIVRRIESTEDIARLERVARVMQIATRNFALEKDEVLPSRLRALQVDKGLNPEGKDAKGLQPLVFSTVEEIDAFLEQQGEQEIDPRLERMVREDVIQEQRQKVIEQAHALGLEVRIPESTPEDEAVPEEMRQRDAENEEAWNRSH